jgi:hypothetical protein
MFEGILEKLQQLDFWSMGIGIVLTVVVFWIWKVKPFKKKPKNPVA